MAHGRRSVDSYEINKRLSEETADRAGWRGRRLTFCAFMYTDSVISLPIFRTISVFPVSGRSTDFVKVLILRDMELDQTG